MTKIIAVASQKGGVGKTTTSCNLSMSLCSLEKKTLLIDFDPQGNASTGLGIKSSERSMNVYKMLIGHAVCDEVIKHTPHGFDLIASVVDLAAIDKDLSSNPRWQYVLKDAVRSVQDFYDYIIIDCPPSLGALTINALVYADSVLIPLQCEFFALEGLSHLIKTIKLIRSGLNERLYIHGVLLTMYDKRNNLSEQVAADINSNLGKTVYTTIIPRNVKLSESPSHGKPIMLYDSKCSGALAYLSLAQEILDRDYAKAE